VIVGGEATPGRFICRVGGNKRQREELDAGSARRADEIVQRPERGIDVWGVVAHGPGDVRRGERLAAAGAPARSARRAAAGSASRSAIDRAGDDKIGQHSRGAAGAAGKSEIDRLAGRDVDIPIGRLDDVNIAGVAKNRRVPNRRDLTVESELNFPIVNGGCAGVADRHVAVETVGPIVGHAELHACRHVGTGDRRRRRLRVVIRDHSHRSAADQRCSDRRRQIKEKILVRLEHRIAGHADVHRFVGLPRRESEFSTGGVVIAAGGGGVISRRVIHRDIRRGRGRKRNGEGLVLRATVAFADRSVGDADRRQHRRRIRA
jgi:hypothetical protein